MRFIVSTLTLAACLAVGMAEPTSQMWPPMNAEIAAFLAVKLANPETLLMPAAAAKVVAMIAENTAQAKDTITASGASSKGESSVYCNGQYKKFLQCLVSGYEDSLQFDNDCVIEFFPTSGEFKDDCRGTGVAPVANLAAAIGGSSGNSYKGFYVIPEESTKKIHPLSCSVCENYTKKFISCALSPKNESEEDLVRRCLPTTQDYILLMYVK